MNRVLFVKPHVVAEAPIPPEARDHFVLKLRPPQNMKPTRPNIFNPKTYIL